MQLNFKNCSRTTINLFNYYMSDLRMNKIGIIICSMYWYYVADFIFLPIDR